jgi:hypothetical protein
VARVARRQQQPLGPIGLLDLSPEDRSIVERALPYTMTGIPRLAALIQSVRYCIRSDIPGSFVECGVWRGGSVLAIIATLQALNRSDRDVYLFDTFMGMPEPTELDVSQYSPPSRPPWRAARRQQSWSTFFAGSEFSEAAVRATVVGTGYPDDRLHFIVGRVEDTLPASAPRAIALLRLDTDWYESTRYELVHLYPRLSSGGVLLIDDYGHWQGARRAVDEYFANDQRPPLLTPIDYSARIGVKPTTPPASE